MHRQDYEPSILSLSVLETEAVDLTRGPIMKRYQPNNEILQSLLDVSTGSTWQSNDPERKPKKQHADVFLAQIGPSGLPMGIVLDGCGPYASPREVKAIGLRLMNILSQLAFEIQEPLSSDEIIKKVKTQYEDLDRALQYRFGTTVVFSASLIFYDALNQPKALSFGTGDTMLLLDNGAVVSTIIEAVNSKVAVSNTTEDALNSSLLSNMTGAPIPFPSINVKGANYQTAEKYLQIKITNVKPDHRLIFLTDGAYDTINLKRSLSEDGLMVCTSITPTACITGFTVQEAAQSSRDAVKENYELQKDKTTITLGDDATIAAMTVPTEARRRRLAFFFELNEYLTRRTKEASDQGVALQKSHFIFFSQWFKTTDGQTKINAATKLIRDLNGEIVHYSDVELVALRDSGACRTNQHPGLGQIVSHYEKLGALPQYFLLDEASYKARSCMKLCYRR